MRYNRRQLLERGGAATIGTALLTGCLGDDDANGDANGNGNGDDDDDGNGEANGNGDDEYPEQPIELVIPFGQGGGTDTINRFLVQHLGEELGTDVVIENIPGAASMRGTQEVVTNRDPDGYSILAFNPPSTPLSYLVHEPDFDMQSLEGIAHYALTPHIVHVNADVADDYGIDDYDDLTDAYQEEQLTAFGGQSIGSFFHVMSLLLRDNTGLAWQNYVGYDGTGPATESVASGETPAGITNDLAADAFESDGLVRPMVNLTTEGSEVYPDLPDLTDFGHEPMDFLGQVIRCYWAPEGTPQHILDTLTDAVERTLERDEVTQWADDEGQQLVFGGQDATNQALDDILNRIPEEVDLEAIRREVD